jgi:alpha-glucosidase
VYIRSFADGDGDGVGDIAGLTDRLPYIAGLGVDAIWINPWYRSPMVDGGYDVADHRDIDPLFGTLDDARGLIADAHDHGLRVLLDLVPNHLSDRHPWFQAALAAPPGSPARGRFIFRDGRGPDRDRPPNDWRSGFGGPAWTRVTEAGGRPGQWYLHLFADGQPDLNWTNPDVTADYDATMRFWFDRGVDGFRIDVAHGLVKAEGLPDLGPVAPAPGDDHPYWDRDGVHEIYRRWRKLADAYDPPRVLVAEAWVNGPERLARYVRPDELHAAFEFDFLLAPWRADSLEAAIATALGAHEAVGAVPTWVLANHDTLRAVSRYARRPAAGPLPSLRDAIGLPADHALGAMRARAAALLMLALPGGAYIYQGEELALPEVEDLPDASLQDPAWERSGHTNRGRDGCRVPIPWSGDAPPFGFSPANATAPPWLPQPARWRTQTVEAQQHDPASTLELYRHALRTRRAHPALAGDGTELEWLPSPAGTLVLARHPGFACVVNVSAAKPVSPPPPAQAPLLASGPLTAANAVPRNTAAWFTKAP